MAGWLTWCLLGTIPVCSSLLLWTFVSYRIRVQTYLYQIILPWAVSALAIYGFAVAAYGLQGAAVANVPVGLLGLLITLRTYARR